MWSAIRASALSLVVLAAFLTNGCVFADYEAPRHTRVIDISGGNGVNYRLWISSPSANPPPGGFRAVYVLDGNSYFLPLREGAADDTVIAAIGYADDAPDEIARARLRDFTTAVPDESLLENARRLHPQTGGVHAFLRVLIDDVRPVVRRAAPINRDHEVLVGHSLSGLAVLHAVFDEPKSFDAYVAASPSIWWGDRAILVEENALRDRLQRLHRPICVFVFAGGLEQTTAADADEQSAVRLARYRMIDNAHDLVGGLDGVSEHLRISFELLAGLGHDEAAIPALRRGITQARSCQSN